MPLKNSIAVGPTVCASPMAPAFAALRINRTSASSPPGGALRIHTSASRFVPVRRHAQRERGAPVPVWGMGQGSVSIRVVIGYSGAGFGMVQERTGSTRTAPGTPPSSQPPACARRTTTRRPRPFATTLRFVPLRPLFASGVLRRRASLRSAPRTLRRSPRGAARYLRRVSAPRRPGASALPRLRARFAPVVLAPPRLGGVLGDEDDVARFRLGLGVERVVYVVVDHARVGPRAREVPPSGGCVEVVGVREDVRVVLGSRGLSALRRRVRSVLEHLCLDLTALVVLLGG